MNKHRKTVIRFIMIITLLVLSWPSASLFAADIQTEPVRELEDELLTIEKELSTLEKRIDGLLEDLIDPRLTSLSIFFESRELRGRSPMALELTLDGSPLATRPLTETDKLVLIRGGALEVFSGIIDPAIHTVAVRIHLSSEGERALPTTTDHSSFKFEPMRAAANYIEITLDMDREKRSESYQISARHWFRER